MKAGQIFRSILRDSLNTAVIIVSLAVGIVSFSLIILFLGRELGTDGFHEYAGRIYALKSDDPWIPGRKMYHCRYGSAEYMKNNLTGVEDFCRVNNSNALKIKANNENYFDNPRIIGVSENFFRVFSYDLLTNNPETALESNKNLVISSDLAEKYFGTVDPVGKVITLYYRNNSEEMMVTGIFQKPVENTQINFDMVRLIGNVDSRCYVRLSENTDREEMEKLFAEKKDVIPVIHTGVPGQYYLESLRQAYFDTTRAMTIENSRDKRDLWIAMIIGILIIGVAIFNYLGILANKFHRKMKEYYMRRINGSSLSNLVTRFILENSIIVLFSFILGLFLMNDGLHFFKNLTGSNITKTFIIKPGQIAILASVLAFLILVTFFFTFYLIRSNLSLNLLKTDQDHNIKTIQIPFFNVIQLASSMALIICSIVIIRQMNFITNKQIGLDKEVIEVKIPAQYKDKALVFKEELMKFGSVKNVSVVGASPLLEHFLLALKYQEDGVEKQYSPAGFSGDENYLSVLGIELVAGDDFSATLSANTDKCLINESFASLFPGQDLVGKGIPGMEDKIIAGIVKDFHYSNLKSPVEPAFISFDNKGGHLMVKASDNQVPQAREAISSVWQKLIPDYPENTESTGDRFEWYHRENVNFKRLIITCSMISLLLSMIGLFAVSYQKARSRTKEIGIRKINGAGTTDILAMINTDFFRWTIIAFIIAVPAAGYAMFRWLEAYAYKTELSWWIFVMSGLLVLTVSLLTVSWQSWRAATRNPVEALRYE